MLLRLDLQDKRNSALAEGLLSDNYIATDSPFRYQRGLSAALLQGYKDIRFMGYEPDTLNKPLLYKDFLVRTVKLIDTPLPPDADELDTMATDMEVQDDWDLTFSDEMPDIQDAADAQMTSSRETELSSEQAILMTMGYSVVIELLEDQIFDKNKSSYIYVPQYVRLVFVSNVNGIGAMPMVAFKYKDIEHLLANTHWRNKHNDAASMNIKDVIRLRIFSSLILNLSGETVYSLKQAERKRRQLLDFEHHLWSF